VGGAKTVGIHGQPIPVEAEILSLHGLSAHADQGELVRWYEELPGSPGRIYLNHGEDQPRKSLEAILRSRGATRPQLPANGDEVAW
jgi:metallo-beta-lactamase family protein